MNPRTPTKLGNAITPHNPVGGKPADICLLVLRGSLFVLRVQYTDCKYASRYKIESYSAVSRESVVQRLLQIRAGHPVVQVGHMDLRTVRERLWTAFRTRAAGGSQKRGGAAGHAGGCASWFWMTENRRRHLRTSNTSKLQACLIHIRFNVLSQQVTETTRSPEMEEVD